MTWSSSSDARVAVYEFMLRTGVDVSTADVAAHRGCSPGTTLQLLYAMREDGLVAARLNRDGGSRRSRQLRWSLTGLALPDAYSSTATAARNAANLGYDHAPLAAALGMCLTPPREIRPTIVHTCDGGDW